VAGLGRGEIPRAESVTATLRIDQEVGVIESLELGGDLAKALRDTAGRGWGC
jgi:hypothetical protein